MTDVLVPPSPPTRDDATPRASSPEGDLLATDQSSTGAQAACVGGESLREAAHTLNLSTRVAEFLEDATGGSWTVADLTDQFLATLTVDEHEPALWYLLHYFMKERSGARGLRNAQRAIAESSSPGSRRKRAGRKANANDELAEQFHLIVSRKITAADGRRMIFGDCGLEDITRLCDQRERLLVGITRSRDQFARLRSEMQKCKAKLVRDLPAARLVELMTNA